jgi:hypothetical protein
VLAELRDDHFITVRGSDWGLGHHRALGRHLLDGARSAWTARHDRSLTILTAGLEIYAAALLLQTVRSRARLCVIDFLSPRTRRFATAQAWLLRRVDAWGCIRTGDMSALQTRFRVDPGRLSFLYFPAGDVPERWDKTDEGYVYSAGAAHRDWSTLFAALERGSWPAKVSLPRERWPAVSPDHVELLDPVPPEVGRTLTSRAHIVVVPLQDTDLPAGPSTLVDALAYGRAVIATDANGSRDYITHEVTGLLVTPGDPQALADAIDRLSADVGIRQRLGTAARRSTEERMTPTHYARAISRIARDATAIDQPS